MLYTKQIEVSEMAQVGIVPTPRNKVEIVTPLPLADLQVIVDGMNEYKMNRGKNPEAFQELGRGHFGTVFGYKGYAIKLVRGGQSAYSGYGDSRKSSGEILDAYVLRQLQSIPSIPRFYGTIDNEIIIMEKIDGMTLRQYQDQMEELDKMDNFIHPDYINQHKEIMKDILMAGWIPVDLHMDNVMVCRQTGKPRIIDVGLFKHMDKDALELRGETREECFLDDFWQAKDATDYAKRMRTYVMEARCPELLEIRKQELIAEKKERELYKAKREERRKREEEERMKRMAERDEKMKEHFGRMEEGIARVRDWADEGIIQRMPSFRPQFVAQFHDFFRPAEIKPVRFDSLPDIDKDLSPVERVIKQKKENQFKKGLHNMLKQNDFIMNVHKNRFAMGK
jgi:serine/threonine protein kinase